jgi:hypothetical protein
MQSALPGQGRPSLSAGWWRLGNRPPEKRSLSPGGLRKKPSKDSYARRRGFVSFLDVGSTPTGSTKTLPSRGSWGVEILLETSTIDSCCHLRLVTRRISLQGENRHETIPYFPKTRPEASFGRPEPRLVKMWMPRGLETDFDQGPGPWLGLPVDLFPAYQRQEAQAVCSRGLPVVHFLLPAGSPESRPVPRGLTKGASSTPTPPGGMPLFRGLRGAPGRLSRAGRRTGPRGPRVLM